MLQEKYDGRRERECRARCGRKRRGGVRERRGRVAGSKWHVGETARFDSASSESRGHCWCRAFVLLLPARKRGVGPLLKTYRANGRKLLRRDDRTSCRIYYERLKSLFHELLVQFLEGRNFRFQI